MANRAKTADMARDGNIVRRIGEDEVGGLAAHEQREVLAVERVAAEQPPDADDAEISELSRLLNSLLGQAALDVALFRDPNGVCMKLANFQAVDPLHTSQGKRGLSWGGDGLRADAIKRRMRDGRKGTPSSKYSKDS